VTFTGGLRQAGAGLLGTMVVVLPAFWTMGQLTAWWRPSLTSVVLAVMLGLSLPRALAAIPTARWPGAALAVIVASAVASTLAMLIAGDGWLRIVGAAGFSLVVCLPVWLRRRGAAWRSYAVAAGLPFVAVLVTPMPTQPTWQDVVWVLVATVAALVWALAAAGLRKLGMGPVSTGSVSTGSVSTGSVSTGSVSTGSVSTSSVSTSSTDGSAGMRPSSDTRLAIQLALAVGCAFTAAFFIDPHHYSWAVLTALLVSSNNRGRGDVLWKGTQRLVGALVGAALATLFIGQLPAGDSRAVVAVFAVIALAAALRPFGYAYWAACITAGLAFLYAFLGESGPSLMAGRLLGIAVGGVLAIAVSWLVLPLRTTTVVRSRVTKVLTAASAALSTMRGGGVPNVDALRTARAELEKLRPTVRAAHIFGIGAARTLAPLVDSALDLAGEVTSYATSRAEAQAVRAAANRVIGLRDALRA